MRPIETDAHIAEGLAALAAADRRLAQIIAIAGEVPLRRGATGFPGLARIIVGQQLSIASAGAIWARFEALAPPSAETVAAASDETLKAAGLSNAKVRTLRALAAAVQAGLDIDALADAPAAEAHAALTAVKGIGPWTADLYLLFAVGHPDIFPVGDLALQHAVGMGLGLPEKPTARQLAEIATPWSPWRGVAARLFWAYYRVAKTRRETVPV